MRFDPEVALLIDRLAERKKFIRIAIAGPSGAGKSTLGDLLRGLLTICHGPCEVLSSDVFFKHTRDDRRAILEKAGQLRPANQVVYDAAQREAYSLVYPALARCLMKIGNGFHAEIKNGYDRDKGGNFTYNRAIIPSVPEGAKGFSLLVDGMWLLEKNLRPYFDLVFRLEAPFDVRKARYLKRAVEKGYAVPERMFENLERISKLYFEKNGCPTDVVVDSVDGFMIRK